MIQRGNSRRLIIVGVGVIVAVIIIALVLSLRGSGSANAQNKPSVTVPVLVAIQTIPQGTNFRAGSTLSTYFQVRQLPPTDVPVFAYRSLNDVTNLIKSTGCQPASAPGCAGQVTAAETIYAGEPVVKGMLSSLGAYRLSQTPSFQIPPGYVGLSIDLSPENDALNSIEQGDTVDLIASYTGNAKNFTAPNQTQYVMEDVKVIGVGGPTATAGSASSVGGGELLLLMRYQQALVIQHLKDFGWTISAVLRSAKEPAIPNFKTIPVTDKWLFVRNNDPFKFNPGY
ncbi:MAG TPA: RcpC/CpaB family pilus assembly protein [Chloroflexota bacterium]|nr:RcpC/CpaB family pilus assembly protein [Chloroflexota bacterium]